MRRGNSTFILTVLCFGFAFLYVPILSLIVYSFNSSKLVTVWGGFSFKWYGELLRNEQILDAALLSLEIAVISATVAVVLGTFAGLALGKGLLFPGTLSRFDAFKLSARDGLKIMLGTVPLFIIAGHKRQQGADAQIKAVQQCKTNQ